MKHSLPKPNLFFRAQERGLISSQSLRFHPGRTPLLHVSYRSPSGARGVVVALEDSLGTPVILPDMHGGWFQSGFLRGRSRQKGENLSLGGSLIFVKKSPEASLTPEQCVSSKGGLHGGCSWEDLSLEFESAAGRSGNME